MPYVPYRTAQQWQDETGSNGSEDTMLAIDWLGALTSSTPYTPYNTASGWKNNTTGAAPQQTQVAIDILGAS